QPDTSLHVPRSSWSALSPRQSTRSGRRRGDAGRDMPRGDLQNAEVLEHPLHLLLLGRGEIRAALPRGADGDALELRRVLHQLDALATLEEDRQRDDAEPEVPRLL